MPVLGLDIGGANIKAATSDGRAAAAPFSLWKAPDRLTDALRTLAAQLPPFDRIAVTMTGELADCFATKAEGVSRILSAVDALAGASPSFVWTTAGRFLSPREAREDWSQVAAANWHALATWIGRMAPRGTALLLDVGSTTTDVIPLRDGEPCPSATTDLGRLLSGELVYTGVRRTPLCAVTSHVVIRGTQCPLAAELFATMLDAYLISGDLPPNENDCDTADGRPATAERACDRMARIVCCDRTELGTDELRSLAGQFITAQVLQIQTAVARVAERGFERFSTVFLSGSGAFLGRRVIDGSELCRDAARIDLGVQWSPAVAESACAYAVAMLAQAVAVR
jgi:hypothetical protein